jgi:hypothetical protein
MVRAATLIRVLLALARLRVLAPSSMQLDTLRGRRDMEHRRLFDDAWNYNANLRAEDGFRMPDRTSAFREFILIPIGFVFATLLIILLITCSPLG